jgi:hypothetical protein
MRRDDACADLDMGIYGADGALVERDNAGDDTPFVQITPTQSGRHFVRLWLYACAAETCAIAARVTSGKPDTTLISINGAGLGRFRYDQSNCGLAPMRPCGCGASRRMLRRAGIGAGAGATCARHLPRYATAAAGRNRPDPDPGQFRGIGKANAGRGRV